MQWYHILAICCGAILILTLITAYVCFYIAFYSKNKKRPFDPNKVYLPDQPLYQNYKDKITADVMYARGLPYTPYQTTSKDGLILKAKYYKKYDDAPIEIMFHGYRGSAEIDMSAGIQRAFLCGHNAFVVDQRASGDSQGHVITFGIKERHDCQVWIDFVIKTFGKDQKIFLAGVSMGAATAIMATQLDLPKNVLGVLADCGYDSIQDIIKKFIKQLKLSPNFFYPFLKLGAMLYGGFNLNKTNPLKAIKQSKIPVIIFHGTNDTYVPVQMAYNLYDACPTTKDLVIMQDSDHGVCFLDYPDLYLQKAKAFFEPLEK